MAYDIIRIRRDSYVSWESVNPTLALGEISYDLTNKEIRVGDGTNEWLDLQPIGSSTIAEGDKGDIVVSSGGTVWELDPVLMAYIDGKIDQGPLDGGTAATSDQVMQLRRDTTSGWTSSGAVLDAGEIGWDTTINQIRIGDGIHVWTGLTPIGVVDLGTSSVNDLGDVVISSQADGEVLTWDSGTSKWINQSIPTQTFDLEDITNVVLDTPVNTDILQFNGTNWVNAPAPAPSESGLTSGVKNQITVVTTADDWVITNGTIEPIAGGVVQNYISDRLNQPNGLVGLDSDSMISLSQLGTGTPTSELCLLGDQTWGTLTLGQDNLDIAEPVEPTDVTTKNYVDEQVGLGFESVLALIDESNGIAGLDSSGFISVDAIPGSSITMARLAYNERDKTNQRNIIRSMYTDGSGIGDFVWSTGTAADNPGTATLTSTDDYSYIQTAYNKSGCVGRVRHIDKSFGFLTSDLTIRDCPKEFTVKVKYDGEANDSHFTFVGFSGNHAGLSQNLCCFDCFNKSTWWMRITDGYTTTPTDRGSANYENVLYYVDTGVPVSDWARLRVVVDNTQARFYKLDDVVPTYGGETNDYFETLLGYYDFTAAELDGTAYAGLELRVRSVGSTPKPSQKLYFKEMTYKEYNSHVQFAPISHTHSLSDISQGSATTGQVPTWDGSAWTPATPTGGSGGVTEGNKGDIFVSGSGSTWTVNNLAITAAKLATASVTANKIATGAVNSSKLAAASVGPTAFLPTGELNGSVYYTTNDGASSSILSFSPNFSIDESGFPGVLSLAASSVSYAKIQNVSATDKLLGRSSSGAGVVEEISCTAAGRALIDDADAAAQRTTLGLDTMATQAASSVNITGGTLADTVTVTTGSLTNPVNQAIVKHAVKSTAGTITAGQVVYVTGATGNHVAVELAKADAESTSSATFGIAMDTITNSTAGHVLIQGLLTSVNTNSFNEGDGLWLSPTTAGALQNTRPTQPYHGVFVGWVVKKSASGDIYVKVQNGYELNEIHDVLISGAATGHLLTWDNSTSLWKNQVLSDASITSNTISGTKIADTTLAVGKINASGTPGSGNFLRGDGQWTTPTVTPTGSTTQVQYNNAGSVGGAANVNIDANGNLKLVKPGSAPSTPATDSIILYPLTFAGRELPGYKDENGSATNLQVCIARNKVRLYDAHNANAVAAAVGFPAFTAVGTLTARNWALTSLLTSAGRHAYVSAASAANSWAQMRSPNSGQFCWRGNSSVVGGFFVSIRFAVSDPTLNTGGEVFVGLSNTLTSMTNTTAFDVEGMLNSVGLYAINGATNYSIGSNDGTSTATLTSLGSSFPVNITDLYDLTLFAKNNDSVIYYEVTNLSTGATTNGSLSSDLPLNTVGLGINIIRGNNASTSSTPAFDISTIYAETPY